MSLAQKQAVNNTHWSSTIGCTRQYTKCLFWHICESSHKKTPPQRTSMLAASRCASAISFCSTVIESSSSASCTRQHKKPYVEEGMQVRA